MENRIKRFLGVALVLLLIVSVLPLSISAAETAATPADVIGTRSLGNTEESYPVYIGEQGYDTLAAAISAAESGATITIKTDGSYSLPGFSKDLTIEAAEGVAAEFKINSVVTRKANVHFKNVTFTFASNSTYKGLQFTSIVFDNCVINGQAFLYSGSETFNNCTFNTTDADNYNVWTYGAKNVTFNGCTFHCAGKSILVYNEGATGTVVNVNNSKLIASAPAEGKAAIEIDSTFLMAAENEKYVIVVDAATTVTGFANGNVSGNSLWNNKKGDLAEVSVNGEKILKIGTIEVEKEVSEIVTGAEGANAETIVLQLQANTAVTEKEPENVPENAELVIELTGVTVENNVATEFVYDVTPIMGDEKIENLTEEIIFRLPVHSSVTVDHVRVYHDKELMGIEEIQGTAPNRYVEIASDEFSEYALAPLNLGDDPLGYTTEDRIWGETWGSALESYVIKVYSGDTYMGSTTLNPEVYTAFDGDVSVTWHICLNPESDDDEYWIQEWEVVPSLTAQPDRVELWIDGVKAGEGAVQMNSPDNTKKIVTVAADTTGIVKGYYTTLADALNAVPDGGTVKLISGTDGAAISAAGEVTGDKTVTITGEAKFDWSKGWLYVGRGNNFGNGKLIIQNAKITSDEASLTNGIYGIHVSSTNMYDRKTNDGVLEIINSDIQLSYLLNRNEVTVDGGKLYVGRGFYIHGRGADESLSVKDETATITIRNGAVVEVKQNNGTGIGDESYGEMNIVGATFIAHEKGFPVRSNGVINVSGESTIVCAVDGAGKIVAVDDVVFVGTNSLSNFSTGNNSVTFKGDTTFTNGNVDIGGYVTNDSSEKVWHTAKFIVADGATVDTTASAGFYGKHCSEIIVEAGGKLITSGKFQNNGDMTVRGEFTVENVDGDWLPKLAGTEVATSSLGGSFNVDGGIVNVNAGYLTFGGGQAAVWTDAAGEYIVTVKNGGKLITSAAGFRNSAKSKLVIDNGTLEFTSPALTEWPTSNVYFDNKGTIEVKNSTVIMPDRSLANEGTIDVSGETTLNIASLTGTEINLLDGTIIKDSTVGGNVFVAGKVLFRGDNTFNMIYDFGELKDYYGTTANMTWSVEKGGSLNLTQTSDRYGLGYGDNVTINGSLEDAQAAREAGLTAEDAVFSVNGISMMNGGWSNKSYMTVNDAYVIIGRNSSFGNEKKSKGGDYTVSFTNSVLDSTRITVYDAGSNVNFTFTDSDVLLSGVWSNKSTGSAAVFTNSKLNSTGANGTDEYNANAGTLTLVNSSMTFADKFTNTGVINIDTQSMFTAPELVGDGTIVIDATKLASAKPVKLIDLGEGATLDMTKITVKGAVATVVDGDLYVSFGAFVDANSNGQLDAGEGYATLADAMTAAAAGDTVVLLGEVTGPVTIDKAITLNLNGCSITAAGVENNDWAVKVAAAGVKITDSSDAASNGITVTGNGFGIWVEDGASVELSDIAVTGHNAGIEAFGDVTMNDGTYITATKTTEECGNGIRAYGEAVITVNGGEIISAENGTQGCGIELYQTADAVINGGTITGKTGICVYGGTLEVKNGTINGTTEYGLCTTSWGDDSIIGKADVTISGGTVNGKVVIGKDDNGALPEGYAASIAITDGTINGALEVQEENAIYTMAVSGGSFNQVVPEKYCAAGYSSVTEPNTEGRYEVKLGYVLNVNTGVNYGTIEAAMKAADAGTVLKLLQAVTESEVVVRNSVTLDLNGQNLTADYVVAFQGSHVVDSLSTGLLDCEKVKLCTDNDMLPVWVVTNEEAGYRLFKVLDQQMYRWQEADSFQFIAKPALGTAKNDGLMAAVRDNRLTVKMRLSWTISNDNQVEQTLTMKKADVNTVYSVGDNIMQLTVTGTSSYVGRLETTTVIESDTGVIWKGTALPYKGAQGE